MRYIEERNDIIGHCRTLLVDFRIAACNAFKVLSISKGIVQLKKEGGGSRVVPFKPSRLRTQSLMFLDQFKGPSRKRFFWCGALYQKVSPRSSFTALPMDRYAFCLPCNRNDNGLIKNKILCNHFFSSDPQCRFRCVCDKGCIGTRPVLF